MNLDQLKQDLCKQLALIEIIDKAVSRKRMIACSKFYEVFGTAWERERDLQVKDAAISRLTNYLKTIRERSYSA